MMTWPPAPPGSEPADLRALLDGAHSEPEEEAPRLVLADWLDERGDPRARWMEAAVTLRPAAETEITPRTLYDHIERLACHRRLRFFATGCCRGAWESLGSSGRLAVAAAELRACDLLTKVPLACAWREAQAALNHDAQSASEAEVSRAVRRAETAWLAAQTAAEDAFWLSGRFAWVHWMLAAEAVCPDFGSRGCLLLEAVRGLNLPPID
jgi:uncharacterized protein (TIGR02996 family)